MSNVIDYPVADMTITVRGGMLVADLQAVLAEQDQHLPIDIPNANSTTIGDAVSRNVSGSRRFGYGTFRDYVIGLEAVDGRGRQFKSGGRVVKNVAGYDLCKLLIGSHGTLANITQLTFKVLPRPKTVGGVRFEMNDWERTDSVLEQATNSATRPIVIDVVAKGDNHSIVFVFDGSPAEVEWQQTCICDEVIEPSLRLDATQASSHLAAATQLHVLEKNRFVAGLPSSAVCRFLQQAGSVNAVAHAANGIVVGETKSMQAVRAMAEGLGGWCRANDVDAGPFSGSKMLPMMAKVKSVFDPDNKLSSSFGKPA